MDNCLRYTDVNGIQFVHTVKSVKNGGVSPMIKAKENMKSDDILLSIEQKKGRQYGSCSINTLTDRWQQNDHLYEVLLEKRKFYFDIEFTSEENEHQEKMNNIVDWIVGFMEVVLNVTFEEGNCDGVSTQGNGRGEKGTFEGVNKYSYHLILNIPFYLDGIISINAFQTILTNKMQEALPTTPCLDNGMGGFSIDESVYGKNQAFKLPYQSKHGSTRVHIPFGMEEGDAKLEDFIITVLDDTGMIPVQLSKPVVNITENINQTITEMGEKPNQNNVDKTLLYHYSQCFPNQKVPERSVWNGSFCLADIVALIYNGVEIPYIIYRGIAFAIKKASGDDYRAGLRAFLLFARKYPKYDEVVDTEFYNQLSVPRYGWNTLLLLASFCCPNFKTRNQYIDRVFSNNDYEHPITTINQRYINILDYHEELVFVHSPMGTGKSFGIHQIPEEASVLVMSSKQAFSSSFASDFKEDRFVSYLSPEFNGINDRLIISLESIHKVYKKEYDFIILDESESIFNIISSPTLIENKFDENIACFTEILQRGGRRYVMDAFLTNRSLSAMQQILPNVSMQYIKNEWKPDEKVGHLLNEKGDMIHIIYDKLECNKRCCLVTGSRAFGDLIVEGVKKNFPTKKIKFYHSDNKLPLTSDVNVEWAGLDLLIYTPTITCGISYTNPNYVYDNLFVYLVNVKSANVRDGNQAMDRVRTYTDKNIYIYLNTKWKVTQTSNPLCPDMIGSIFNQKSKYFNENLSKLTDMNEAYRWVSKTHIFNIMEKNTHSVHLTEIAREYFKIQNISLVEDEDDIDNSEKYDIPDIKTDDIDVDKLEVMSREEYEELKAKMMNHDNITSDEYLQLQYFTYYYYLIEEERVNIKEHFTEWYVDKDARGCIKNLKKFRNRFLYDTKDEWIKKTNNNKYLEHIDDNVFKLCIAHDVLEGLGKITPDNKICSSYISDEMMNTLVGKYKKEHIPTIQQKFKTTLFKKSELDGNGFKKDMNIVNVKTILNEPLRVIGYELTGTRKKIPKTRQKKTYYNIAPIKGRTNIINLMKDKLDLPEYEHMLINGFDRDDDEDEYEEEM